MFNSTIAAEAKEAYEEMQSMLALAEVVKRTDVGGKTSSAAIIGVGGIIEHARSLASGSPFEMIFEIENQKDTKPSKAEQPEVPNGE